MSPKPPILILAILGSTGSGKSVLGDIAVEHYGFTRLKFAGPLKDMLKVLGANEEDMNGSQEHRSKPVDLLFGKSWRYAMQTLGSEWRDLIDKRLWARIARKRLLDAYDMGLHRFVIDDARFPHEIEELAEFNPIIVAIRRPTAEPSKRDLLIYRLITRKVSLRIGQFVARLLRAKYIHVSEGSWFDIPYEFALRNNRKLRHLTDQCHAFLDRIVDYQSRQIDAVH